MMQTDNATPSRASTLPPAGEKKFDLSESAQRRIAKLLTDEPEGTVLRISVMGGGCSGFQYKYDFETTPTTEDDFLITSGGARVAVDSTSLEFLAGSILDYVETLGGSAFEIKNPNTTSSCGCGNSFSVV
jgi:iron-sulfur cluster insertion protein